MSETATAPLRIVVIGYGPVGSRLVEGLLPVVAAGLVSLTVVGAETHDAYNRVLLAEYAVGRSSRERLDITDTLAARAAGARIELGRAALWIDRETKTIRLDDSEVLQYDRLVFATGSRAHIPPLEGLGDARRDRMSLPERELDRGSAPLPAGVVTLRDLADAATVRDSVTRGEHIVVLGGGVLGTEFALAAHDQGADVTVVYSAAVPMDRNLDAGGGTLLARLAGASGVRTVSRSRAEGILLRDATDGLARFQALYTADGKQIDGDLLVLSCGVMPRVELAAQAGLDIGIGILVDRTLASWADPHVYAIGDCAHVASRPPSGPAAGAPSGLVGPGWRQADQLAAVISAEMTGTEPLAPLAEERPAIVALKAEGIDVVSAGLVRAEPWDAPETGEPARQVAQWIDPEHGRYVKLVATAGVLDGFVCVGMPRTAAELTMLFERRSELPSDRSALLRLDMDDDQLAGSDPNAPDATVCWCNGVSVAHVRAAATAGAHTIDGVGIATRAGTGCGGCRSRISELISIALTDTAMSS